MNSTALVTPGSASVITTEESCVASKAAKVMRVGARELVKDFPSSSNAVSVIGRDSPATAQDEDLRSFFGETAPSSDAPAAVPRRGARSGTPQE